MYIMPWHIVFSEDLYLCPFPSISRLQQIYQTDCSHSLVSARTHSISRYIRSSGYIYIQTFYIHKRNVLRFLPHGTYHVVVRGGLHFCQSPKGGGSGVFFIKTQGKANPFFGKKYQNFLAPSPQDLTRSGWKSSLWQDGMKNCSRMWDLKSLFRTLYQVITLGEWWSGSY